MKTKLPCHDPKLLPGCSIQCHCVRVCVFQSHRRDRECLRRHLSDSRDVCCLLRIRMQQLIDFLHDLLSSEQQGPASREHMTACLDESRRLLADVASKHVDHGTLEQTCTVPFCIFMHLYPVDGAVSF